MSIVLFSAKGIHYQDKSRGPIMAVFVPQLGAIRRFTDMQNNNAKEIAARYGATQKKPIFKVERGQVIVYGVVTPELSQKIEDVSVYLPEQMVSPKCNAFYFIFGTHVVHGIQETDDEGRTEWKVAHLTHPNEQAKTTRQKNADAPIEELVVQQVVSSMAERMITVDNLEITIAVTGNNKLLKQLQEKVAPYDVEAIRFETLRRQKKEKPLYRQYNYSLMLLSVALCSLVLVGASAFFWYQQRIELQQNRENIRKTQREIAAIKKNPHVGYIQNPQAVLDVMKKAVLHPPSSLLNAAAQVGDESGTLNRVFLDVTQEVLEQARETNLGGDVYIPPNAPYTRIIAHVYLEKMIKAFLVDQERDGKSILKKAPWVEEIKSYRENMGNESVVMEVILSLEEKKEK